jgi:integration host factor subunit beta
MIPIRKMNKSDLVKKISEKAEPLHKEDIEQTVNIILDLISNSMNNGNRVEIRNFGTFSVRSRDRRISRNPKTGTAVMVEVKHHPYFRASKYLRESLNK